MLLLFFRCHVYGAAALPAATRGRTWYVAERATVWTVTR
jgi:hypothetical protein